MASSIVATMTMLTRAIGGAVVGVVLLAGCSAQPDAPAPPAATTESVPLDPLTQMSIAFEGQPSISKIKPLIDAAMQATETPITDENYSRAGSALVGLRKKNGTKEMTILKCMPSRVDDPRLPELSFPNVAAVCSVDIVEGTYVDG